MPGPELGDETAKAEDFADRDGMNPERWDIRLGRRQLQPETVPQEKALFLEKPHPDEMPRRVEEKRQEKKNRIQPVHA